MTCLLHAGPVAHCMGCLGRWDRPLADKLLREGCSQVTLAAALRAAMAEIEQVTEKRAADLAEHAATYEAMRVEIARLTDELDHATSHDGDWLSKANRRMCETVLPERDALRLKVRDLTAELDVLRCYDLDAFADGELTDARAAAFRDHLARCPACEAALLGRIQEHAVVSASLERRDAVVDAAVAWVRAGGTLAAIAAAVNNMEDGNG